jgi:hypothetical protein
LAHSWWNSDRRGHLPLEIFSQVMQLKGKIDNVKNGILLRKDLSWAFDNGKILFEFIGSHYHVVVISPEFERYDWLKINESTQVLIGGHCRSWKPEFPDPLLVKFHLQNSVMQTCVLLDPMIQNLLLKMSVILQRL